MVRCKYSNQELNTKNSTEAEVFGVSDYLPYNILICLLMGAQGYDIKQNIFFQNNQSAINMEKRERSLALENPGTLIYITSLLRTGFKARKINFHTVSQNICSHIFH